MNKSVLQAGAASETRTTFETEISASGERGISISLEVPDNVQPRSRGGGIRTQLEPQELHLEPQPGNSSSVDLVACSFHDDDECSAVVLFMAVHCEDGSGLELWRKNAPAAGPDLGIAAMDEEEDDDEDGQGQEGPWATPRSLEVTGFFGIQYRYYTYTYLIIH